MLSSSETAEAIQYSGDVVGRVQAALIAFRAATGVNGRKRAWAGIAHELEEFLVAPGDYFDDDQDDDRFRDPIKALAEALRRFAAGVQVPSPERLAALGSLLVSRAFLTEMDLRPAAPDGALLHALTSYFGAKEQAKGLVDVRLVASRKTPGGRTDLSVVTVKGDSSRPPAVEDCTYSLPIAPRTTDSAGLIRLMKRSGGNVRRFDGWLFRSRGTLCMIVRDSLKDEPAVYTVITNHGDLRGPGTTLILLKSCDFGNPLPEYGERLRLLTGTVFDDAITKAKERIWSYQHEGERP